MPVVKLATCSVSEESLYNQIIARIEIKGIETSKAPINSFRFANSLAPTTKPPDRRPLTTNCHHTMYGSKWPGGFDLYPKYAI
tara:strand:- start:1338 stop:1586 length:249 start_codon:yes stop_codon:yes gene_type:complete